MSEIRSYLIKQTTKNLGVCMIPKVSNTMEVETHGQDFQVVAEVDVESEPVVRKFYICKAYEEIPAEIDKIYWGKAGDSYIYEMFN